MIYNKQNRRCFSVLKILGCMLLSVFFFVCGYLLAWAQDFSVDTVLQASAEEVTEEGTSRAALDIDLSKYPSANLIPFPYSDNTKTEDGVTFTNNGDGSITVNGTPTNYASFSLATNFQGFGEFILSGIPSSANLSYTVTFYNAQNDDIGYVAGQIGQSVSFDTADYTGYDYAKLTLRRSQNNIAINNVTVYPMLNKGKMAYPYQPYLPYLIDQGYQEGEQAGHESGYEEGYQDGQKEASAGFWQGAKVTYTVFYNSSSTGSGTYTPTYISQGISLSGFGTFLTEKYGSSIKSVQFDIVFSAPVVNGVFKSNMRITGSPAVFGDDKRYSTLILYNGNYYSLVTRFALVPDSENLYGVQFLTTSFPPGTSENTNNWSAIAFEDITVPDVSLFLNMSFFSTDGYYESGYNTGYYEGVQAGKEEGIEQGKQEGYQQGYDVGHQAGYNEGIASDDTVFDYINAIITAPVDAVLSMFDVDFMGWNLKGLLGFLVCGAIIVIVLKIVL